MSDAILQYRAIESGDPHVCIPEAEVGRQDPYDRMVGAIKPDRAAHNRRIL